MAKIFPARTLMFVCFCIAFPLQAVAVQYEATRLIHIKPMAPTFLVEKGQPTGYERFVNTQMVLMRLPDVIDKALETPEVAKLQIVVKQKDKAAWLAKELRIEIVNNSEIVSISIRTDSEDASEKIINAVVNEYLAFIEHNARDIDRNLLNDLLAEKRKQQQIIQQLQDSIREKTKAAANKGAVSAVESVFVSGGSLQKELSLAQADLAKMQAQLKAVQRKIDDPGIVPPELIMELDPELAKLTTERRALVQRREELAKMITDPIDPKIIAIDREIAEIDAKIAKVNLDEQTKAIRQQLVTRALLEKYQLEQDIQSLQIYVEDLQRKYNEQLDIARQRSAESLDVSFELTQLARANKIIDAIDDRILAIQTESKAPVRIVPLTKTVITPMVEVKIVQ